MLESILTPLDIAEVLSQPPARFGHCDGCNQFDELYGDPVTDNLLEFCPDCWAAIRLRNSEAPR